MANIFTIGYSNQEWSDFTSTLEDNYIDVVVDVRRYPGSKTCPQFNKEQIKAFKEDCWCVEKPIDYVRNNKVCYGEVLLELLAK